MEINYEVHNIENAVGTGKNRKFVSLQTAKAKTTEEMAQILEQSSTVTAADIKAVMSEFSHFAISELQSGNRVYIPEIGYLSLSVGIIKRTEKKDVKITGKDIYIRNVNFQPEAKFLAKVQMKVSFKKTHYTSLSTRYTENEIWSKIKAYLSDNDYLTRRIMREQFGLSEHTAKQWLNHFVTTGKLKQTVIGRQQVYRQ